MSVKIALLKSNEEVICDIKEVISNENKLEFYCLKDPYVIKINSREDEDGELIYSVTYNRWILLSHDREFFINPDWIVTLYNPNPEIKTSYTEKINGRLGNDEYDGTIGG